MLPLGREALQEKTHAGDLVDLLERPRQVMHRAPVERVPSFHDVQHDPARYCLLPTWFGEVRSVVTVMRVREAQGVGRQGGGAPQAVPLVGLRRTVLAAH